MPKRVLSVGFVFPGDFVEFVSLDTRRSLLDADIVIFRPSVGPFYRLQPLTPRYQGQPSLADDASFELKDAAAHWRQQIQLALTAGKTVFVFLPTLTPVWVNTGQRNYSGTGRNQRTTRIVEPFDNYRMLPSFAESVVPSEGTQMKLANTVKTLASYWTEFGAHSSYKVVFQGLKVTFSVMTAAGDMPVGCSFTVAGATGRVVALPALTDYDLDPGEYESGKWSKEDRRLGQRLLSALLSVDEAFRAGMTMTPPPDWAGGDDLLVGRERELRQAILAIDREVEAALMRKADLSKELTAEGKLRGLLYENGKPLESAILVALRLLGFEAEPFKDAQSEFDAVFVSPEGRFLGEAEGKEGKAVNIDKLRQLEMNIQEDFEREGATEYARGVLFGNAYRLQTPEARPKDFFTAKCLTAARRSQTALVRTPDLFFAARYIRDTNNQMYAQQCRRAILEQGGKVVQFPAVPAVPEEAG